MTSLIRKHQNWLMALIAVTVITFLFWGSSVTNPGHNGRTSDGGSFGSIDGQPVTQEAFQKAQVDTQLAFLISRGEWVDSEGAAQRLGFNLEQETYMRLFLTKRAKDMGIRVDDEKIGRMAGEILTELGGKQGPVPKDVFEKQLLEPRGLTLGHFRRYLETQALIQELVAVVGQNGRLVTPQEAESDLRRESEQVSVIGAFFPLTNQLANVTVTAEQVSEFYQKNASYYRQPDRRQVSYVKFKAADYFDEADKKMVTETNLDRQIDQVYQQRGTNYFAGKTAAEAKTELRAEYRRSLALRAAREVAAKFGEELINVTPMSAANLEKLATEKKLAVDTTSPFTAAKPPVELDVNATFCRYAFALTAEEPIDGRPIPTEDAVYVIALKKEIPSGVPPLDSIRDTVTADCKMQRAAELAFEAGNAFAAKLAAGKDFAAAAAESKVEVVKLPPYSLLTRELPEAEKHISLGYLQQITAALPTGVSSGLRKLPTGGAVLQVAARTPAPDSEIKAKLADFIRQSRSIRQGELFNNWLQREANTALRDTPLSRRTK